MLQFFIRKLLLFVLLQVTQYINFQLLEATTDQLDVLDMAGWEAGLFAVCTFANVAAFLFWVVYIFEIIQMEVDALRAQQEVRPARRHVVLTLPPNARLRLCIVLLYWLALPAVFPCLYAVYCSACSTRSQTSSAVIAAHPRAQRRTKCHRRALFQAPLQSTPRY
jgi:hypothetical protein